MVRILLIAILGCLAACSRPTAPEPSAAPADEPSGLASTIQVADPNAASQLLQGWHGVEQGAWRWTERRFSVALKPPAPGQPATLQLKFSLPEALLARLKSVTLTATINGAALPAQTYDQAGAHDYVQSVPAQSLSGDSVRVDFAIHRALGPDEHDRRELGVVVSSVGLQ